MSAASFPKTVAGNPAYVIKVIQYLDKHFTKKQKGQMLVKVYVTSFVLPCNIYYI